MIADPHAVATDHPRAQALVELATLVTERPWYLSRAHLTRARAAGLSDADVLHAVALAAYFGHLNRIADAVAVPLDYTVKHEPPRADPSVAALAPAPTGLVGRPALDLGSRAPTAKALGEWKTFIFQRDAPLTRRQRTLIARHVAGWLGDGSISPAADLTANPLDDALRALAQTVTLAPWQLTDDSYTPLRRAGFDDVALFDVVATASSAGVFSRIEVALVALGS
ncbi:MAG: carboxymuconolactone decarboxylase family protein [Acidobacteriota bacterium]